MSLPERTGAEDVDMFFSDRTGPDAPHDFRIGLSSDLGTAVPLAHARQAETVDELQPGCVWPQLTAAALPWWPKKGMQSRWVSRLPGHSPPRYGTASSGTRSRRATTPAAQAGQIPKSKSRAMPTHYMHKLRSTLMRAATWSSGRRAGGPDYLGRCTTPS